MKFIFDFDSVLFNTKEFLKHLYACVERAGVPKEIAQEYYKKVGGTQFSLKKLLIYLSIRENLHEEILSKSKSTGLESFFSDIIIVAGSKKEAVEKICAKYKDEKVIFIDEKAKYFEDLDFVKYPNLKTVLYDEKGLEKLISILS